MHSKLHQTGLIHKARRFFWLGVLIMAIVLPSLILYFRTVSENTAPWELLVGAILSIWVTAFFDMLKSPELMLQVWGTGEPSRVCCDSRPAWFVHAQVVNRPLKRWFGFFQIHRARAVDASGTVVFRDPITAQAAKPSLQCDELKSTYTVRKMPIRWANTSQTRQEVFIQRPEDRELRKWTVVDLERLTRLNAIRPGPREHDTNGVNDGVFGIAHQFEGEEKRYGTTNECYTTRWRPKSWLLYQPRYLVDVEIEASNAHCSGVFSLSFERGAPEGMVLSVASRRERKLVQEQRAKEARSDWQGYPAETRPRDS